MKRLYLILALAGAAFPYLFFVRAAASPDYGMSAFLPALFGNPVSAGFTADLAVSSPVFWVMMAQTRRSDAAAPNPARFILLNLLIGLSCALPAWLYAREVGRN